jgi:hypothetical protein
MCHFFRDCQENSRKNKFADVLLGATVLRKRTITPYRAGNKKKRTQNFE